MQYLDTKYIHICSSQLRNFKRRTAGVYNFSCPICGDSEKKKSKARGYMISKSNSFYYHCHNCGVSLSFPFFLKKVFPLHYQEYIFEKYSNKNNTEIKEEKSEPKVIVCKSQIPADCIADLAEEHYAKEYIKSRKIPQQFHKSIYYTDNFKEVVDELFPNQYDNLLDKDCRIIIPFLDQEGNLLGIQGRSLDHNNSLRYITVRADQNINLIYGLDRIDFSKTVYVVEGPIDSMFIPNCLAVASSDLEKSIRHYPEIKDVVFIFDNEPRNKQIVKLIDTAITNGRTVCIWPNNLNYKDINDIIKSGVSEKELLEIVQKNTVVGLKAKMKFLDWKKC